jgi:hypothetical protein
MVEITDDQIKEFIQVMNKQKELVREGNASAIVYIGGMLASAMILGLEDKIGE